MSAHYIQPQPPRPGGIKVQLCRSPIFSQAGRRDHGTENPLCFHPSPSPDFFPPATQNASVVSTQASLKTKPEKAFQFRQIVKKMKPLLGECSLKKRSRTCLDVSVVFNPFISDTPSHAAAFSICPYTSCILKVPV